MEQSLEDNIKNNKKINIDEKKIFQILICTKVKKKKKLQSNKMAQEATHHSDIYNKEHDHHKSSFPGLFFWG